MEWVLYSNPSPVVGQGGPGTFDGTTWSSNFTFDIDFGPGGFNKNSLFTSAISAFLAYEGSPIFYCGIVSYTPVGSANPVFPAGGSLEGDPVIVMPPVTSFTVAFGCSITPEQGAQSAVAMANMSVLLQA